MLHSIKAKNFYSFKDEVFIDFTVNDKAPTTNSYYQSPTDVRISKLEAVVGPNAAGKSNLLKIAPFFCWLIVHSYKAGLEDKIPLQCSKGNDAPAEIEVIFEVDEKIYTYSFSLDRTRIYSEVLKATSMANQKKSTKTLFSRTWDADKQSYSFSDINFSLPKGTDEESLVRANASVVSAGIRFSHKESVSISNFWEKLRTNVDESNVGFNIRYYFLRQAVDFYKENPDIREQASKYMSKFDLGLSEFNIRAVRSLKEDQYEATFTHSFNGKEMLMPIDYESAGTQQLFIILTDLLMALKDGGVVVVDEFDLHLHPDIQTELIEMFSDPVLNPKNAQLFFSTQSPMILNKLDKYQIILCEKKGSGYSEAFRLDEIGGVRSDESYGTKYLAGAYGATPRL